MDRELENMEFESAVTAIIAALSDEKESQDVEGLKNRIRSLNLDGLLNMQHEHEVSDELIIKCRKRVNEFYQ